MPDGKKRPRGPTRPGLVGTPFVGKRVERYLEVLRATGEKVLGRHEVGVGVQAVDNRRHAHPEFQEDEQEALRLYRAETIVAEIQRRGVKGVEEPIFWQGVIVGHVVRYSDKCLMALAKYQIEGFRDSVKIDQKTEVTTTLTLADMKGLPPDELALVKEFLAKIQALRKKKKAEEK